MDTRPNPALLIKSASKEEVNCVKEVVAKKYLAAYMLTDEGLERAGRTQRTNM